MFIKQVIIYGFKSYKDQTVIEPFSPRHNVVVGRNGSGKSNFFWAIRFVLGDAFAVMSREERQSLLHEGAGPATLSAYVEMVFDNADNRLPTGRAEVVLRRTIGLKKDEYSLDKKSVSKGDVVSLLEAAGFSRSNPYYIVPQGRVTALCHAKDAARLELLKQVAGTQVYEDRRVESLQIMEETVAKRGKVLEFLEFIAERLASLEGEKQELRAFQDADRERRCVEYAIYQQELDEVGVALERLDAARQAESETSLRAQTGAAEVEAALEGVEARLLQAAARRDALAQEREEAVGEQHEQLQRVATLEVEARDAAETATGRGAERAHLEQELAAAAARVAASRAEVAALSAQLGPAQAAELEMQVRADAALARQDALLAKQGRAQQFATQDERDEFLRRQISDLCARRQRQEAQAGEWAAEVAALEAREGELAAAVAALEQRRSLEAPSEAGNVDEARARRTAGEARRKALWREEAQLTTGLEASREALRKAERGLWSTADRSTSQGLRSVEQVVREQSLQGVHGPLFELFEVDAVYQAAVEAVAGNSLFHVVVDTDETATVILEHMARLRRRDSTQGCGRVTFMPLNRLEPRAPVYPESPDVIPMIRKLRFDAAVRPAVAQTFGQAIICRQLSVAASYAVSHKLTGVTLDGDRAERKGALTGGFHDARRSRLELARQLVEHRGRVRDAAARLDDVRHELVGVEQAIAAAREALLGVEAAARARADAAQQVELELRSRVKERAAVQASLARKRGLLGKAEGAAQALGPQIAALEGELVAPMESQLSADERKELAAAGGQIAAHKRAAEAASARRAELEARRNALELSVAENLLRRQTQLEDELGRVSAAADADALAPERRQRELEQARERAAGLGERAAALGGDLETAAAGIVECEAEADRLRGQLAEAQGLVSRRQDAVEKHLSRRHVLLKRKDEATRNVRELGVLPDDAYERFRGVAAPELVQRLRRVNDTLKQFAHVNKKAVEQYGSYTKERDHLQARKADLDADEAAILNLIRSLDQRKDDTIQETFAKIAANFQRVFEALVPLGRGELVMVPRAEPLGGVSADGDVAMGAADTPRELYAGVAIRVSFNSKADEGLLMQQLSGGQKSLVALALIFAIQMCDPAPFYLFDEVDANLDAAYRSSVALMIHQLSDHAQFITTTFRPELCAYADQFYGVTFAGKVSRVGLITKDEAIGFVEADGSSASAGKIQGDAGLDSDFGAGAIGGLAA